MGREQVADTLQTFLRPDSLRWVTAAPAALVAMLWEAFTSVLAMILVLLWLTDLALGVLRAIHESERGLEAFEWQRFWRAWIKMAAALVGIALFVGGDALLHSIGVPDQWSVMTAIGLIGMCWGFFWSALGSFSYFWPEVGETIVVFLRKLRTLEQTGEHEHDRRWTDPKHDSRSDLPR